MGAKRGVREEDSTPGGVTRPVPTWHTDMHMALSSARTGELLHLKEVHGMTKGRQFIYYFLVSIGQRFTPIHVWAAPVGEEQALGTRCCRAAQPFQGER